MATGGRHPTEPLFARRESLRRINRAMYSGNLQNNTCAMVRLWKGYASLAKNIARSGEISRIWGPSIIAHNTTRKSHGQDLLRVWLQPSLRRGEMFVFPLPYPCYTTWALGKTVQVKFLMIDIINLDMSDPGKRKTRPDSTEFSLFFCNLGFSAT